MKFFNHQLYKEYYPLTSEQDKNTFLESNHAETYKFVRSILFYLTADCFMREKNYTSKLKPTISFFGTVKHRNIIHNKYIISRMHADKHIRNTEERIRDLGTLATKLMYTEFENITTEELNYVLKLMNSNKHREVLKFISAILIISICAGAFLYLN